MTKIFTKLDHEPPKNGVRGNWVVTYRCHDLDLPTEKVFKTKKIARRFIKTLKGGDK